MCGIVGIFNRDQSPVSHIEVEKMIQQIRHRGPDDIGFLFDNNFGAAHARLSIVDLKNGRQPISDRRNEVFIFFNGEIYNHKELRSSLRRSGYPFKTETDTECILALYMLHEDSLHDHLDGQWSFAIWDRRKRSLFLSRDRFGITPLHYFISQKKVIFSSEAKSILFSRDFCRDISSVSLISSSALWSCPPGTTFFEDIQELEPGTSLTIDLEKSFKKRYYFLDFSNHSPIGEHEACDRVRTLLEDSVTKRLHADVPVATYLSGGLDSSIITSIAANHTRNISTFSIRFNSSDIDESPHQESVARHFGTNHNSIYCSEDDIADNFCDALWHIERPIHRTAPIPMFILSRFVSQSGFKCALSGEGSDEFFCGYDIFKQSAVWDHIGRKPDSKISAKLLNRTHRETIHLPNEAAKLLYRNCSSSASDFTSHTSRWKNLDFMSSFLLPEYRQSANNILSHIIAPHKFSSWTNLQKAMFLESTIFLPGYILSAQGDRVGMAHSVESRHPFLNAELCNFAMTLPKTLLMRGLQEKRLLKMAYASNLPKTIIRRRKMPYSAHDASCFISPTGELHPTAMHYLSSSEIKKNHVFNQRMVNRITTKLTTTRKLSFRENSAFYTILSTQILFDIFKLTPPQVKCEVSHEFAS